MIFLTGSTGFVGTSLINFFEGDYILKYSKSEKPNLKFVSSFIHLAGKAHDLINSSSYLEYYKVNTDFTKEIFDSFLASEAKVFITLSSVKAVADEVEGELHEEVIPNPITHYGKSKLLAEQYILSQQIPLGKRVYILRPCMIHGPGNKGNLNLLYRLVSKWLPWPLGAFSNSRSYLSIENLCFIIKELIDREAIPSGVYNVSDDLPLSTNEIVDMIAKSKGCKVFILNINKTLIKVVARLGDILKFPLNSERLHKLTESYVVSNVKIRGAIGKPLPISSRDGLKRTFLSFSSNA